MVLANGEVVRASPQENADLFFGTAGAYGTLGVVAAAEVQLVPAKPYVELEYRPVRSFEQAAKVVAEEVAGEPDYVDGIMFGRELGVIIVGRMVDQASGQKVRFTRPRDEWFYLHVEKRLQQGRS